ncbi:MAG: iron-sulfur cluster repair di-iron protein [Acidobacteriaceae bacterium]|jgi:regulator of cell morphogenesis and NO signaling
MTSAETHQPTTHNAAEYLAAALTVRDIALRQPTAIRVFEHLGIDYCCGGNQTLASACAAANLDAHAVQLALEFAAGRPSLPQPEWGKASLELLCAHIIVKHHAYARRELPRLLELCANVLARHGEAHPELAAIHATLSQLETEINEHLAKEESVLFPYIVSVERSLHSIDQEPISCYGFLPEPVAVLSHDHEEAAILLAQIRQLSHNFTPPLGVCLSYRIFYTGLQEFEHDFRQHTHLENNILFPRAIMLEANTAFAVA